MGLEKELTDLEKKRNADKELSSEYEQAKTDFNEGRIKYDDFIRVRDKYNKNRNDRGLNPDRPFEYTNPDTGNKELKDADETIKSVRSNLEGLGNVSTLSNFTNLGTQFQTMFAMFNDDKLDLTDLEKTDMLMEGIGAAAIIAGNSISNIGSELEKLGASGAVAKVGAVTAAIGQIVLGFAAASYQASKLGAIGWIAWLGAGLAALATTISTVSSFADGGIIQGSTFHGDKMLARVNAGEMILNQKQQSNLFNVLNNGTGSKAATSVVKIKGSDIYLALSNYNSKMSKIR